MEQARITEITSPILVRVIDALAAQYRVQFTSLGDSHRAKLRHMLSAALADKKLLAIVSDETTAAVGFTEDLIEMKLRAIVKTTVDKFLLMTHISQ